MSKIKIRAHHGLCTHYFEGKGYSDIFSSHMAKIIELLDTNPMVEIITECDEICQKCPNLIEGVCNTADKVNDYDQAVLGKCNLKANTEINWLDFKNQVVKNIIANGKIKEICADCEWTEICHNKL